MFHVSTCDTQSVGDAVISYGCRLKSDSDVALLGNDDVMYPVGSIVVIYNSTQHKQRHYLRHTAAITWYEYQIHHSFCCLSDQHTVSLSSLFIVIYKCSIKKC